MAKKLHSVPSSQPKAGKPKSNGAAASYWASLSEIAAPEDDETFPPLMIRGLRRESVHRKIK